MSVQDSGLGLDEAERQRLGERFSRVMGNLKSGSGLGWSTVRRIAAVHQMEVLLAASAELGGLAVRASLLGWARQPPNPSSDPACRAPIIRALFSARR